jgi:hypothetical protein
MGVTVNPTEHIHEKVLVSNLLFGAVGKSSNSMDTFSNWLLTGFAAVIAILISNLDKVSTHIPPGTLNFIFLSFFIVAAIGIAAKALAVVVAGASAGANIGREEGMRAAESGVQLDVSVVFAETERAIIAPMRWLVRRSFAKAVRGDFAAAARTFACLAQFQALLALAQAAIVLLVIAILTCKITF